MASQRAQARSIAAFFHNPFAVGDAERRAARTALANLDVAAAVAAELQRGRVDGAVEIVLAAGHARAAAGRRPQNVLAPDAIPAQLMRRLPHSRTDYLRVSLAAGRCYQVLDGIRGTSDAIRQARYDTWAACFGGSLRELLELEQVVRGHDVLILGETGTGKELFARAMIAAAPGPTSGAPAPSAAINAAAIPESLVESELFGHVAGAFTGAVEARIGRIRSASSGVFFLDEVGDLPRTTQAKLLRVIETDEVFPVGSDTGHAVDVRYVAATHKRLDEMTDSGEFRRDLFERLAGNIIRIPALRDRPGDIADIGRAFARAHLRTDVHGERVHAIDRWLRSAEARHYAWPGNVRELQNALRNLMLGLPPGLKRHVPHDGPTAADVPDPIAAGSAPLSAVEDWYIARVLAAHDYNYAAAARALDVDRSTVKRRAAPRRS